jgi:hypothetical protein
MKIASEFCSEPSIRCRTALSGDSDSRVAVSATVSTQGMDSAGLPVARRDITSFPHYLGWARV